MQIETRGTTVLVECETEVQADGTMELAWVLGLGKNANIIVRPHMDKKYLVRVPLATPADAHAFVTLLHEYVDPEGISAQCPIA